MQDITTWMASTVLLSDSLTTLCFLANSSLYLPTSLTISFNFWAICNWSWATFSHEVLSNCHSGVNVHRGPTFGAPLVLLVALFAAAMLVDEPHCLASFPNCLLYVSSKEDLEMKRMPRARVQNPNLQVDSKFVYHQFLLTFLRYTAWKAAFLCWACHVLVHGMEYQSVIGGLWFNFLNHNRASNTEIGQVVIWSKYPLKVNLKQTRTVTHTFLWGILPILCLRRGHISCYDTTRQILRSSHPKNNKVLINFHTQIPQPHL